jgi:predicted transcriptional regulator
VDRLIDQRSTVDALRSELARSTRAAAADLRRLGFSTRDVGEILGISGSRVAQMDRESGTG